MAACGGPTAAPVIAPRPANVPVDWPLLERVTAVRAARTMVVSGSPAASDVGVEILEAGGNAVDAAVAVGFALAVVHPEAGNIGGGGFMVIRFANGRSAALDYRETAPGRATRDMYVDSTGRLTEDAVVGHRAAGVPGSVAGLVEAHARYGRLGIDEVMAPAIRLARDGFVLDEYRSRSLAGAAELLRRFETSRRQFLLPNGQAPPPGTRLVQSDLARTLMAIAEGGADAFYHGQVADLIVAEMERGGGLISREDLSAYRPKWREPIETTYRGRTIYSMPPASSGGVTLAETLNILEGFAPLPAFASADQVHLVAEAMRRAFVDRNRYLGDPAFVQMPLDRLLSKTYAASLRNEINPTRATPTPDTPPTAEAGTQTTHYSVVDATGNAVAVTTTINSGYGNGVTVAGAGFLLNNEMDDFTSAPGVPNQYGLVQGEANAIAPGKRMLSAMTPTIVTDTSGALFMILGTPGGPTIITTVTQVISNVIDHHMSLPLAVAVPRIHHQALPDQIFFEPGGLTATVQGELAGRGHTLRERGGFSGDVAAIIRDGLGWLGVADPRRGGGAAGR
jgi:gamma-glutamyltranspeptidase/glutathione hydrolase